MDTPLRILSLGAGVQTTTLLLMAAKGEISPAPDCAIFADTQWEPASVYLHLDWLTTVAPFPIHTVTAGNLRQGIIDRSNTRGKRFAAVPWFMRMENGDAAMGIRQCTYDYKIQPIHRKVVELLGGRPKGGAELWMGISIDEVFRMKPSRVNYIVHRWPLVEHEMSRHDCFEWLKHNGYPEPPKSACIGCPYHSDSQWRTIRSNPGEWNDAVQIDRTIRHQPGFRGRQYMHSSLVPLDEVDLSTPEDHGQLNLFNNECEGLCGV